MSQHSFKNVDPEALQGLAVLASASAIQDVVDHDGATIQSDIRSLKAAVFGTQAQVIDRLERLIILLDERLAAAGPGRLFQGPGATISEQPSE